MFLVVLKYVGFIVPGSGKSFQALLADQVHFSTSIDPSSAELGQETYPVSSTFLSLLWHSRSSAGLDELAVIFPCASERGVHSTA